MVRFRYDPPMNPAVFLDRDDTLIECRTLPAPASPAAPGDLIDPARVSLLPGVAEGLARLKGAGFRLVVVSNQGVVARGGATIEMVEAVNEALRREVRTYAGVELDGVYFCPFHPRGAAGGSFTSEHHWRKPEPGMILTAAWELGIDPYSSWMIGDAERDIESGKRAGIAPERCLLICEDGDVPDVGAAAEVILASLEAWHLRSAGAPVSTMLMHGAPGADFSEPRVRATVLATARGIAERSRVRLLELALNGSTLRVAVAGDRLVAMGLLAEVRRATTHWYEARAGRPLWSGSDDHGA